MDNSILQQKLEVLSREQLINKLRDDYGQNSVPSAKKPTQPTKVEIIQFILSIEKEFEESDLELEVSTSNGKVNMKKILADMKKIKYDDKINSRIRVRITKNAHTEDEPSLQNYAELMSYGSVLDAKKAWVPFGVPWHLPLALVEKLESIKISNFVEADDKSRPIERVREIRKFNVERLPMLTKKELEKMSEQYKLAQINN